MESLYKPEGVEARWQETWEAEGLYAAGAGATRDESFVICVPPPNVTGDLHLGHALNGSIQDVLVRWHRMQGFDTLWQPGYDHAGIATQNVVEKQLATEGLTRHDLGREAFVERTWEWLELTGRTIMGQYRRLGASLDYSRERFTLDEAYSRAVTEFFVRLWDRGWIYRANRIVNWCPFHQTAISDLEVEHAEMDDVLTYALYPFADGDGEPHGIVIATVRPATILADVAVAVHPDDPRYRTAIGREVIVPFVERRVPVIADARVEPSFGSGALKITPGHDPLDFEIGRDHELPEPMMIGPDGRMNDAAGELAGLPQAEADAAVVAWLEDRGQLVKRESYRHSVGTCERCHSRIEPLISLQWWCRMEEPAQPALDALRERRVRFHPVSQHRFAISSLEEIPDWCLSRQLWWGHQLPIWTTPDGETICAATEAEAQERAGAGVELMRDPDVLDTWFSSALWPFATLGWPEQTPELAAYYPGNVNSTAREIIRLWENRMIWAGLELMRRGPVHRRDHPLDRARRRRTEDVEEPRQRRRSDRDHRRVRRGRDALRPPQDLVDAGRQVLPWRHRRGAQAHEQALERLAPDPAERRGHRAGLRPHGARGALDPGADRRRPRSARGSMERIRLRHSGERPLSPHVRRLLRLVRGGRQAAAVRARGALPVPPRSPRSSGCSRSAPGSPARDRGDLVAPPR